MGGMKVNRSIPSSSVIPVLVYADVQAATDWLVSAFGFRERLRIGEGHRNQLVHGDGAIIVADATNGRQVPAVDDQTHSLMVRVEDARAHADRAPAAGAVITSEPADMQYGERQYSARDPWGHHWTFSARCS